MKRSKDCLSLSQDTTGEDASGAGPYSSVSKISATFIGYLTNTHMHSKTPLSWPLDRPPQTLLSQLASLMWRRGVRAPRSFECKEIYARPLDCDAQLHNDQ